MGIDSITQELDRLYEFEMDKYVSECDHWKKMGYKIYRNSEGKHKVVEPVRPDLKYNAYGRPNISSIFPNDVFGDIFGGMF